MSVQPRGTHLIDEINHLEIRAIEPWERLYKEITNYIFWYSPNIIFIENHQLHFEYVNLSPLDNSNSLIQSDLLYAGYIRIAFNSPETIVPSGDIRCLNGC